MKNAEHNEAHSRADGIPRRLFRIVSNSPNLAKTKPQNAVDAKQRNVIQHSTVLEVMVAAPPRIRQTVVTTNSARKMIPLETIVNKNMRN
jgi:hypothetical protein